MRLSRIRKLLTLSWNVLKHVTSQQLLSGSAYYASFDTFDENKLTLSSSSLGITRLLIPRTSLFLQQTKRGFKSRRAEDSGGVPFKKTTDAMSLEYRDGKFKEFDFCKK
jgi:hypothetical protein